jgi:CheY-like chemotaxis protein
MATMMTENERLEKIILIVEDDSAVRESIRNTLKDCIDLINVNILEATDAGQAIKILSDMSAGCFVALLLDLMLPYGDAAITLNENTDPDQVNTGINLLEWIIDKGKQPTTYFRVGWTAIITARNNPQLIGSLQKLLNPNDRIYFKPFTGLELAHDLAIVLGIKSSVPLELLPPEYRTSQENVE